MVMQLFEVLIHNFSEIGAAVIVFSKVSILICQVVHHFLLIIQSVHHYCRTSFVRWYNYDFVVTFECPDRQ